VVLQITYSIFALHVDEEAINIQGAAESDAPQTCTCTCYEFVFSVPPVLKFKRDFWSFLQLQTDGNCKYFKYYQNIKICSAFCTSDNVRIRNLKLCDTFQS